MWFLNFIVYHDTYVIFTHFDETFYLIDELNKKFNEIKWQGIKNINVFYSEGKAPYLMSH